MSISNKRLTVSPHHHAVVFLVGMRVNKWWMLPILWGVGASMARMVRELCADPDSGLLNYESYSGRTTLMIQYWRSEEALLAYAKNKSQAHAPAWRQWIQRWGLGGAVGIWHETYRIEPGNYECVYHHMPRFGLGAAVPRIPATGALKTAAGRLRAGAEAGSSPSASTT